MISLTGDSERRREYECTLAESFAITGSYRRARRLADMCLPSVKLEVYSQILKTYFTK
jgi:hypothetical protein